MLWSATVIFTFCTRPSESGWALTTCASCHWLRRSLSSLSSTISLVWMLGWTRFHIWPSCKDRRKSFFQWYQNLFAKCWTLQHLLREYRSACLKSPGGGKRMFAFMVSGWFGVSSSCELGVVNPSVVSGLLLTIASASRMKIRSHSSSVGQNFAEAHIGKHKWNESQTPHIWLAEGGFILNSNQSQLRSRRKLWILASSISATRTWHPQNWCLDQIGWAWLDHSS